MAFGLLTEDRPLEQSVSPVSGSRPTGLGSPPHHLQQQGATAVLPDESDDFTPDHDGTARVKTTNGSTRQTTLPELATKLASDLATLADDLERITARLYRAHAGAISLANTLRGDDTR